jgi:hypothetical protein
MAYQDADYDSRINDAIEFLRLVSTADSQNRMEGLEDLKFAAGDQWPVETQNSRNLESRPCLTINKLDAYCRQVTNQQRQQRPRIKVHPTNTQADAKVAQILEGITRHIEINSNADTAYDTAFDYAVRMGWGYWRVTTKFVSEDSFDQEIYIDQIDNPFTVYFDPDSRLPDGSDAERCLITTMIPKAVFNAQYPDADDGGQFKATATGDSWADWVGKEDIRIAEYFYTERVKAKLVMLSDGTSVYKDELPNAEALALAGIQIIDERESFKKVIKWCKLTAMQVLEERTWDGKYIPVVPVYGVQYIVDDKRKKYGLVRYAKDPQRMYNYWRTSMTESVALAPKAKWLLAEGQDEGHETEWAKANVSSAPTLRYKQTDIDGRPAPQPSRLQPEPPPTGIMTAAAAISDDLQTVLGIFDPSQMPTGNVSGKALNGQQMQADLSNYHFYDNLTRSMRQTGKIILDLIPHIYDRERVMRIIGDDGQPDMVTLNQRTQDEQGVAKILNDVTVGEYDVVMDTGPGYNSKRIQAVEAMMPLLAAKPELFQIAGDLVFRNMDFPGAEVIADRLAASNPLAQIDDKSPIPPQVQMQLAQSKQQIQQLQQQLTAMGMDIKYGATVKQAQEAEETKRELMRQTSKAHNTETMAQVRVNDQNTRAITSQNKSEIEGIVQLLLHHMDTRRLEDEIDRRNLEQQTAAQYAVADITQGANPLTQRVQ